MPQQRHRTPAHARRFRRLRALASPAALALVLMVGLLTAGVVVLAGQDRDEIGQEAAAALSGADLRALADSREDRVSRSGLRRATVPAVRLAPRPVDHQFATAPLNVWTEPREEGRKLRVLASGTKVAVTGQVVGRWTEVLFPVEPATSGGKSGGKDGGKDRARKGDKARSGGKDRAPRFVARWVNSEYLADKKPKPEPATSESAPASSAPAGVSTAACVHGSSVESGLTPGAVGVYRAVCSAFPSVTSYGGYAPRGEHYDGRALDIMVSGATGYAIAEYLRANAGTLGIRDIIFAQRIWTPDRASEGWRPMSDRGSATANHYDHVHVAVY